MINLPNTVKFKQLYKKFLEATTYMAKKRLKSDPKSDSWLRILASFDRQVVEPMEELWQKMLDSEKNEFLPKYTVEKDYDDRVPF